MNQESKKRVRLKRVLFVDFNGVISYYPFWFSLQNPNHPLHQYFEPIEQLFFIGENKIVGFINEWMLGKYTSEDVHKVINDRIGAPYNELLAVFCEDAKKLDISEQILAAVQQLKKDWYCILSTDNMDSFDRYTLPANPQLSETFNVIHNSYPRGSLKKTNNGVYFVDTVKGLGINFGQCVLIDDSNSTCEMFQGFGGVAYCTKNEEEVLSVLKKLLLSA